MRILSSPKVSLNADRLIVKNYSYFRGLCVGISFDFFHTKARRTESGWNSSFTVKFAVENLNFKSKFLYKNLSLASISEYTVRIIKCKVS